MVFVNFLACDRNCMTGCDISGGGKCDGSCKFGYTLSTANTCIRKLSDFRTF